jgi:hypothetical protein
MTDGEEKYRIVVEGPATKDLGLTGKLVVNRQNHNTFTSLIFCLCVNIIYVNI